MAFALLIRPVALRERVTVIIAGRPRPFKGRQKARMPAVTGTAHRADDLHLRVGLIRTRP
jgi:hypothetical protein